MVQMLLFGADETAKWNRHVGPGLDSDDEEEDQHRPKKKKKSEDRDEKVQTLLEE